MFTQRRIVSRVEFCLLVFLFYGVIIGAAPKVVGPLEPGLEIVTLDTRPGITMRVLLAVPSVAPKGSFIFFPGGSGQLVGEDGQVRQGFSGQDGTRLIAEQGFVAVLVDWHQIKCREGAISLESVKLTPRILKESLSS
jgi:hypothetical protein